MPEAPANPDKQCPRPIFDILSLPKDGVNPRLLDAKRFHSEKPTWQKIIKVFWMAMPPF